MKHILFISKGESASSTRYRGLQYFDLLRDNNYSPQHITISGGLFPILSTFYYASRADVVILIRKTFPWPVFWLLRLLSQKLIFDFDDAIFCNTDGSYSKTRMNRFVSTIRKCDIIFAGNRYLAETARQHNANTVILPTSLDTRKYITPHLDSKSAITNFTLAWIGSQSTKKYIKGVLPALEAAATLIPNLQLKIIADFELHSNRLHIDNIQWSEENEAAEINSCDIGLAPLTEDDWTKGKCALKVLQYMASGLAVISSPTGANRDAVEQHKSGFLADHADEWTSCIQSAFQQRQQLPEMGQYGRAKVIREFDIHVVFKTMLNAIKAISR